MTMLRRHQLPEAGFTLLEMLVVLAIISVVSGASVMLVSRRSVGLDIKAAANALAAELRLSRARAIWRGQETFVVVDVAERKFWNDGLAAHQSWRQDMGIDLVTAAPERNSPAIGRIRYFPDGSSTGGMVTLHLGAQTARVSIDWLTGIPRISSP